MDHIDSIRGIAALTVAFFHIAQYFMEFPSVAVHGDFLNEVSYQLGFGRLGVTAFFAISGFVICPTLRVGQSGGVRRFFISRFFRLFPAFWISILLAILVNYLWVARPLDASQVLGNIPMFYSLFGVEPLLGVYWTLEVELIFYLLCVVLFLLGCLHKPVMLFWVAMILMGCSEWIFSYPDIRSGITRAMGGAWVWAFLPWNLAIMLWGGLFRIWYDEQNSRFVLGAYSIPVCYLVITLLGAILLRPIILIATWTVQHKLWAIQEMVPFILGLGLFIVGALYIKLNNRFLAWLGTISYSIYLLHLVAIQGVHTVLSTHFPQWMSLYLGVYELLCVAVSIFLAALVYYSVEKPAISLGRRLQKKWD